LNDKVVVRFVDCPDCSSFGLAAIVGGMHSDRGPPGIIVSFWPVASMLTDPLPIVIVTLFPGAAIVGLELPFKVPPHS
jgi:hypothetical protein